MQDKIDQILDTTTKFLINEYNFVDVFPTLRFMKADREYKDVYNNDYRGLQIVIKGSFEYEGAVYETSEVALIVYADDTYENSLERTLEEIKNPGPNTRWCIERLIMAPCIEKVKRVELV